ncbi:MAG: preprotein translocase subunit SecA [Planctomycetota bacterium]|nr:preprotein translocase subunit SecA [Planctomycetota bacterium]
MAEQGIPLIGPLLNRIIGTRNDRFVKKYTQRVGEINALEQKTRALTDAQIRAKLEEFRGRVDKGESPDAVMAEAFAVAREAMDRAVGIRNIFNPRHAFDPSRLPEALRGVYAETRAKADATPPAPPTGEWQGCAEPVPGWMQVEIPAALYEAVRELYPESRPPFRARPFDVQLIGGMVLCQGKIAEMKTGEGKTIVGPLACYMAAVERMKVHVVTVNDYLVQRDRDWTFPFFHALGMTVGAIHPQHMQDEGMKRVMYRCDVVYGTTSEFGFDYLRDNMKRSADQQVQRRRDFAIVDEVDSILIDEARTPLIISGQAHDDQPRYDLADRLARHLVDKQRAWNEADEKVQKCMMRIKGLEGDIRQSRDRAQVPKIQEQLAAAKADLPALEKERARHVQYYELKLERKSAQLTHDGISEAQRAAGIGSFYVDENLDLPHLLEQSLRAHTVYERDRDYVVMPGQDPMTGRPTQNVVIVDVNTGRPMIGRQWSDGLHQAVECKEAVPIKQETQTVATVTIQNFFKMYKRLAGMTGTADTEAQEFHDIYKLDVVAIPTNKKVVRRDFDDLVYLSAKDKWGAIVDEIKYFHDAGRPILVGTTSVEKSEMLSRMLTQKHAIHHEVLNAKQHEREAHIVENAGQLGAVMIATNMAGRGTDIKLGPVSRATLLDHYLRRGIAPRTVTAESDDDQLREGVYRKIASKELDVQKRDTETMPFAELELALLRHWAAKYTWLTEKQIAQAPREELLDALDSTGRFLLHRIRWFGSIEDMGGLHVIGTERHEARRIDNQLRGRSGRQGDNGSSRFFVSLEDDLMKMFAGETTMKILARLGMKEGDAIEHPMLSKSVANAQKKVEERNFHHRKNVLEYDEVMEHQRQAFYGMRQRVIEGRDVRGLIFDFIKSTVDNAVDEYLDPDFPFVSAAEFAKAKLECSITPERLRGKELVQMEMAIVDEALYEARQSIALTLGEYLPEEESEARVDFDAQGLVRWARNRFGVDINPDDLRSGSARERASVENRLVAAAERVIQSADLSGLAAFVVPNFGAQRLAEWVKDKLDFDVTADEIVRTHKVASDTGVSVTDMLMKRVEEMYRAREVEYPVDFAMQMTQMQMRQDPGAALAHLVAWANRRFGASFTPEEVRRTPPARFREGLLELSRAFVDQGRLDKAIAEAQACATDEALEAHLRDRYAAAMPDTLRYLKGDERVNAIRARVESILRAELLQFERAVLLETLDTSWKDHLYAMDQLRDTINFRAVSQQDPRIEFKREGSQLFQGMMETVRARITEYIFKARLEMQAPPPPARPAPVGPAPLPRAAVAAPAMAGGIVGPGFPMAAPARPPGQPPAGQGAGQGGGLA